MQELGEDMSAAMSLGATRGKQLSSQQPVYSEALVLDCIKETRVCCRGGRHRYKPHLDSPFWGLGGSCRPIRGNTSVGLEAKHRPLGSLGMRYEMCNL